ncbi:hypothetical protein NL108_015889 [Boleophthalmus pectinirostris]|nr:hypothetical protein NL108_015889 [Boleophthalmus pectinirostris]
MSLGVVVLCVLTLVELSDEAVYKKLSSVDDLKSVYSEKYLPMHNLILLHWFANTVNINNNNVVHLTYDPSRDFGSHYYGNCDEMLAPVPQGYQYYTVGNLNPPNGNFPPYVLYPQVIEYAWMGRNRDRIIVQAQTGGSHRVSQMYLTKHFTKPSQCSRYDPNYTFELSTDLLQQLRLFSFTNNSQTLQQLRDHFEENIDDTQLNDLINIWGSAQARLGLLFLIVTPQRANMIGLCKQKSFLVTDSAVDITDDWQNCELQQMQLDVKTGDNGKAKIVWRNVPQNQINDGAAMVLFNNQIDQKNNITYKVIQSSEGSLTP